jgi:isopentenyldiphosphate isomerase
VSVSARIIVVDQMNRKIGHKDRASLQAGDIYRVSALWVTNASGDILLAQRRLNKEHDPGKWGPAVAGTIDEGETYDANIIKEAREEIGVELTTLVRGPLVEVRGPNHYFCQWYSASIDRPADAFVIETAEVERVLWFTPAELRRQLRDYPHRFLDLSVPLAAYASQ